MDLFLPRKFLTKHLEKLVDEGVIRGVAQAQHFVEIMNGGQANHAFVYVTHDRNRKFSKQGKNNLSNTQVYTLYLAWQNANPDRSGRGHGMDEGGEVQDIIEWHVHGTTLAGEVHSQGTGTPFEITDPPETLYRAGGWEFIPMSFEIPVKRKRPNQRNQS